MPEHDVPLVSIVITNYQYEAYVRDAIDSALAQSWPSTETIVVDDGSTDGSRDAIAAYGDRIVPVLKENGGQASAFEAGFNASRGEAVLFLDADDVLAPDAIARAMDAMREGVAKVQFRLTCVDSRLETLHRTEPPYATPLPSGDLSCAILTTGGYASPPTSGNLFTREALRAILPMPTEAYRVCADSYLILLAPLHGEVASVDETLGSYRMHGANLWARASLDGERLRRMLRFDRLRERLLLEHAAVLGREAADRPLTANVAHLAVRLASLRTDPDAHPEPTDRRLPLLTSLLRTAWTDTRRTARTNATLSVWACAVALSPAPIARSVVPWLFDPDARPAWMRRLRPKGRSAPAAAGGSPPAESVQGGNAP